MKNNNKLTVLGCDKCPGNPNKFNVNGTFYCVFKEPGGVQILRDDSDGCPFIDAADPDYAEIIKCYQMAKQLKASENNN